MTVGALCPRCGGYAARHCQGDNYSHVCDLLVCARQVCRLLFSVDRKRMTTS